MKLFYKTGIGLMMAGVMAPNAFGQTQIPNSDFEGKWIECVPWTFYGSEEKYGEQSAFAVDSIPTGWMISKCRRHDLLL